MVFVGRHHRANLFTRSDNRLTNLGGENVHKRAEVPCLCSILLTINFNSIVRPGKKATGNTLIKW
jgi:hypothetical protein